MCASMCGNKNKNAGVLVREGGSRPLISLTVILFAQVQVAQCLIQAGACVDVVDEDGEGRSRLLIVRK